MNTYTNQPAPESGPLSHYHFLISGDTFDSFSKWRNDFFTRPDGVFDFRINQEQESVTITRIDPASSSNSSVDDRDPNIWVMWFPQEVDTRLKAAETFAKRHMDNFVFSGNRSNADIQLFLQRVLNQIRQLKKQAKADEVIVSYPQVMHSLSQLEDTIETSYGVSVVDAVPSSFTLKHIGPKAIRTLKQLHESLTSGTKPLLAHDTPWKDFKNAFTGKEVETKMVWPSSLGFLRHLIIELLKGKVEDLGGLHWQVAANCFAMVDPKTQAIVDIAPAKLSNADRTRSERKDAMRVKITKWVVDL